MPQHPVLDTQLDLTLIEVRPPRIQQRVVAVPPPPPRVASVLPAAPRAELPAVGRRGREPRPAAAEPPDVVAVLCLAGAAGLGFSGVVVASMALAAWQQWLPAPAAALFGLGGLLLGTGASACFATLRLRQSGATRYRSRNTVVARDR